MLEVCHLKSNKRLIKREKCKISAVHWLIQPTLAPNEKWLSRSCMLTLGIGCKSKHIRQRKWVSPSSPCKVTKQRRQMCLMCSAISSAPSLGSHSRMKSLKKLALLFNWKMLQQANRGSAHTLQQGRHAASQMFLTMTRWHCKWKYRILIISYIIQSAALKALCSELHLTEWVQLSNFFKVLYVNHKLTSKVEIQT